MLHVNAIFAKINPMASRNIFIKRQMQKNNQIRNAAGCGVYIWSAFVALPPVENGELQVRRKNIYFIYMGK